MLITKKNDTIYYDIIIAVIYIQNQINQIKQSKTKFHLTIYVVSQQAPPSSNNSNN